jgi:hypothetical protein
MDTMKEHDARVKDALTWVAQEARGAVMSGVQLPVQSKLREALKMLEAAYAAPYVDLEAPEYKSE